MTVFNKVVSYSFNAGADLSSSQYKAVVMNSSANIIDFAQITNVPIGILQNTPVTGEPASVIPCGCGGISKIAMGATVASGALASAAADGEATSTASTDYNLGLMTKGGVAGDVGEILLSTLPLTV